MIYIDMDGVVSDFDKAIVNIFGEAYSNRIADKFWKETCVEAEVFRKMPPIVAGVQMVKLIAVEHDICFMTSTGGMPHHTNIAKQKLDWLNNHDFGKYPVAFAMNTKGKGAYASTGSFLIDDREKVCEAWKAGGGIPILFTVDRAAAIANSICEREIY